MSTYVGSGYSNLLYYKYDNKHDYGFTWDDSVINSGEKGYTTEYGYSSYKNLNKRVKFTGDSASKIQVFNVTADQLSNVYNGTLYRGTEFAFVNIPSDARVVVNVTGGETSTGRAAIRLSTVRLPVALSGILRKRTMLLFAEEGQQKGTIQNILMMILLPL